MQIGPVIAELHLFMYFEDGGHPPSWIFVLLQFWTTHDVPIDGLNFPCEWCNDPFWRDWDIAISRYRGFGWKMPIQANFRQFLAQLGSQLAELFIYHSRAR